MEAVVTPPASPLALGDVLARCYEGRRVLVTGHNGFVGSWLCHLLARAGAEVTGYSLPAEPEGLGTSLERLPSLRSLVGDVRDLQALERALEASRAELVVHLAAQALVLPSYEQPVETLATNVMGTAHLLEAVRRSDAVRACLVVTSDKCYATGPVPHDEGDPLGGDDPYSASKAAAELVTHAYRTSFAPAGGAVATTRAGNIVGGGDLSAHRVVPDLARALRERRPLVLRRPDAIRPWQHVLDAVAGYLRLGAALLEDGKGAAEAWNFGPPASSAASVGQFVDRLLARCRARGVQVEAPLVEPAPPVAERSVLTLESSKAERRLAWRQVLDLEATAQWTIDWYAGWLQEGFDPLATTRDQIERYLALEAGVLLPGGTTPAAGAAR